MHENLIAHTLIIVLFGKILFELRPEALANDENPIARTEHRRALLEKFRSQPYFLRTVTGF